MSDNLRRYRAIRDVLAPWYPIQPQGHLARPLPTLAALLSGIGASTRTPLPTIAPHVPDGTKAESRGQHCSRWLGNDHLLEEGSFLPYADLLLRHWALQTVGLGMEGCGVGRGGVALRLHVGYKGRALPLTWRVRQGPQGHCPEDLHGAVVELVSGVLPEGAQVVWRGDGACDGTRLPHTVQDESIHLKRDSPMASTTEHSDTFSLPRSRQCTDMG